MSPRTRRLVKWLGVTGTTARGAVFALAGVLVIEAAVSYQPSKAGGIDKALLTLRGQPKRIPDISYESFARSLACTGSR